MKIIPQNGNLLVEFIGPGDYSTKSGVLIRPEGKKKPHPEEVCRFKVLAVNPTSIENAPYAENQVICAQGMFLKGIRKRNEADAKEKSRFYLRHVDVLSVIEEETTNAK